MYLSIIYKQKIQNVNNNRTSDIFTHIFIIVKKYIKYYHLNKRKILFNSCLLRFIHLTLYTLFYEKENVIICKYDITTYILKKIKQKKHI